MERTYTPEQRQRNQERVRRWREANPERAKELSRLTYERNRGAIIARSAQWQKDNPERSAEINRQASRRWAQRNPEKVRERDRRRRLEHPDYNREYHFRNLERDRARALQWGRDNPEKIREAGIRWRKANPERCRAATHRRLARLRDAAGSYTADDVIARFVFHGNRCVYCGTSKGLSIDHMIPLVRGGSNWPANLVPACLRCNQRKGTRTYFEFVGAM